MRLVYIPAISTPAICSRFFHSCIFHPCICDHIAFFTPAFSVAPPTPLYRIQYSTLVWRSAAEAGVYANAALYDLSEYNVHFHFQHFQWFRCIWIQYYTCQTINQSRHTVCGNVYSSASMARRVRKTSRDRWEYFTNVVRREQFALPPRKKTDRRKFPYFVTQPVTQAHALENRRSF